MRSSRGGKDRNLGLGLDCGDLGIGPRGRP